MPQTKGPLQWSLGIVGVHGEMPGVRQRSEGEAKEEEISGCPFTPSLASSDARSDEREQKSVKKHPVRRKGTGSEAQRARTTASHYSSDTRAVHTLHRSNGKATAALCARRICCSNSTSENKSPIRSISCCRPRYRPDHALIYTQFGLLDSRYWF